MSTFVFPHPLRSVQMIYAQGFERFFVVFFFQNFEMPFSLLLLDASSGYLGGFAFMFCLNFSLSQAKIVTFSIFRQKHG